MEKRHIKGISKGEKLFLNLNYEVSKEQFQNSSEPINVVEVTCVLTSDGARRFVTNDMVVHNPKDFQYDYKGYFYKSEDDLILWTYTKEESLKI